MFARIVLTTLGAFLGAVAGGTASILASKSTTHADYSFLAEHGPAPHHVPPQPGGVSFRFAMIHDVLHERYPKHGPAWHRESERIAREKLANVRPDVQAAFLFTDDLTIALARQGRREEAIRLLREKRTRQEAANVPLDGLYSTFANLGTLLMHEYLEQSLAGNADATLRFREGRDLIKLAVQANARSHFNREIWLLRLAEFLPNPKYGPRGKAWEDFLGNNLADSVPNIFKSRPGAWEASPRFLYSSEPYEDPSRWEEFREHREFIARLGKNTSGEGGVPFDVPMLGVVGMWRESEFALAHLALAIGETMLRVGQRYLAWSAYERASRLVPQFSPDPDARKFLIEQCRYRQREIEETLDIGAEERVALRPRFDAELAHGEAFQAEYQAYEAERIARGTALADPDFYRDFNSGREPIATPSGPEEQTSRVSSARINHHKGMQFFGWIAFGFGAGALISALLARWLTRCRVLAAIRSLQFKK